MTLQSYLSLLLQLLCVTTIAWRQRHHVSAPLNWMLSSAFVTTPLWDYAPLADVGMVFAFDLVMVVLLVRAWLLRSLPFGRKSLPIVGLVFLLPLLYAPFGYLFVPPAYVAFQSVLLTLLLYRAFLIAAAASFVLRAAEREDQAAIIRLLAMQFLGLFFLGFLQYVAGLDLVVYERIKDVENTVDTFLSGEHKVLLGFGFLGLFRGAVAQMGVVALFWWMLLRNARPATIGVRLLFAALLGLLMVSMVGSLSRIGIVAIVIGILYAAAVGRGVVRPLALYATAAVFFLFSHADLAADLGNGLPVLLDRFDLDQFTGASGSGVTRLESAHALLDAIGSGVLPWISGLGGYNPIATERRYELFGMHGDYLDIIARYGVVVGSIYLVALAALLLRPLSGFFSPVAEERALARAFGGLVLCLALLAVTQGTLLFSGAAGYLACAQTWMAIAFVRGSQGVAKRTAASRVPLAT